MTAMRVYSQVTQLDMPINIWQYTILYIFLYKPPFKHTHMRHLPKKKKVSLWFSFFRYTLYISNDKRGYNSIGRSNKASALGNFPLCVVSGSRSARFFTCSRILLIYLPYKVFAALTNSIFSCSIAFSLSFGLLRVVHGQWDWLIDRLIDWLTGNVLTTVPK